MIYCYLYHMSHMIWLVFHDNAMIFISLQMQAKRSPLALGDSVLWRDCWRSGIKPHPFVHVTSDHIIHAWEPWHMWVQSDWLDDPCSRQTAFRTTFMQAEIKNNEKETIIGKKSQTCYLVASTTKNQNPNPASSYLSGGTKDVIWCYWPSTSPWYPPLPHLPNFIPAWEPRLRDPEAGRAPSGRASPVSDKPWPGALARMAGKVSFHHPPIASSNSWGI